MRKAETSSNTVKGLYGKRLVERQYLSHTPFPSAQPLSMLLALLDLLERLKSRWNRKEKRIWLPKSYFFVPVVAGIKYVLMYYF